MKNRRGMSGSVAFGVFVFAVIIAIAMQVTGMGGRTIPKSPVAILFIGGLVAFLVLAIVIMVKRR